MNRYRVTIPQLGTLEIEDCPQGSVVEWSSTVYQDGHQEGVLVMHDGITYHIETCFDEEIAEIVNTAGSI